MRILLVNKFYYRRGGDCIYTLNLEKMLREHGHKVAIFAMHYPDNFNSSWNKYWPRQIEFKFGPNMLEAFMRPFGTNEVREKYVKLIDSFKPDVIHLGNIHSQISPIVAEIAHKRGVKVVWSIHDYKLLCPRYDFLQNGFLCEECLTNNKAVLIHKCMKKSYIASLLGYLEAKKWNVERIEACVDNYICASEFVKHMMLKGGFSKDKLKIICHSIDTNSCRMVSYPTQNERKYYCFVGRLSHEKGLATLISVAKQLPYKLIIVGNGPLEEELRVMKSDNIEFVGFKEWNDIKMIVHNARFCVVPSEWYEVLGLVNLETQCLGTPILGAKIGSIPYVIDEGITGMTFESRNQIDLRNHIVKMWDTPFDYEYIAKSSQEKYSPEIYYQKLMKIYGM